MPIPFHIFRVENFPNRDSFETEEQLTLLDNDDNNMETSVTKVLFAKNFVSKQYRKYDVVHEFLVRLKYSGRARGQQFMEYVTPYKFQCFVEDKHDSIPKCILVQTKAKVAQDFIARLNDKMPAFKASHLTVNIDKLRPLLQVIKGAWFNDMKAANLSVTGVFGDHVDRSKEFKHAMQIGKLHAVIILFPFKDKTHTVMLTEEAGIILYDVYDTSEEMLDVVSHVKCTLLDPLLSEES